MKTLKSWGIGDRLGNVWDVQIALAELEFFGHDS